MAAASPRLLGNLAAAVGALVLLAGATFGAIGDAPAASAHNYLVSSTPEAGSVLTVLPTDFVITTNDVLLDFGGQSTGSAGALEVQGPDGQFYGDGCVLVSGASISTAAALGPAGDYTVIWRVVSTDGHPVSNEFSFTWQPDADQPVSLGSTAAPVCATADDGTDGAAGAAGGSSVDSGRPSADATAQAASEAEFVSMLAWAGGALLAVVVAVAVTLLVLRRPKLGTNPGSGPRPPTDI
jgi:methionine-rich copper-binding protein CopC